MGAPQRSGNPLKPDGGWDLYTGTRPSAPARDSNGLREEGYDYEDAREEGYAPRAPHASNSIHMKLFDDKIPTYEEFRYNGSKGGDRWRLKVRGYWLSKCPQLLPVLTAVELSDERITKDLLARMLSPDSDAMCDMPMSDLSILNTLV